MEETELEPISFELTLEQTKQVEDWVIKQDKEFCKQQLANFEAQIAEGKEVDGWILSMLQDGIPYYGASGGALSYSFTPTSLGVIETVRHAGTKQTLNLTDYDLW